MSTEFYWFAVVATTVVSASRLTRLATVDKFPPVAWLRNLHREWTDESDWQWLTLCGYCFSFWAVWPLVLWGLLAGVYDTQPDGPAAFAWWVFNGIFAITYLAGVFMAYDGADEDD